MRQNHLPRSACLNAWGRVAQHEASGETQKISSQCGNMAHSAGTWLTSVSSLT